MKAIRERRSVRQDCGGICTEGFRIGNRNWGHFRLSPFWPDGLGGNWSHDAEGRVISYNLSGGASGVYTYDALGQRVERTVNGTTTYDYVFDNGGHENTKGTAGFAGWTWSELYLGGMRVGTYANSSTYFAHTDHLGSSRMETDPTGNTNSSFDTNLPFGEYNEGYHQSEIGFTSDLLDYPDSRQFHTPNRELNVTEGRWMSPDPAGLAAVDPANPQTWNRYAYVGNNPTSFVDPTGMNLMGPCGENCVDNGGGNCDSWFEPLCDWPPIFTGGGGGTGAGGWGSGGSGTPSGNGSSGTSVAGTSVPWQEWGTANGLPPGWGGLPGFGCDFGNVCNPIGNGFLGTGISSAASLDPGILNLLAGIASFAFDLSKANPRYGAGFCTFAAVPQLRGFGGCTYLCEVVTGDPTVDPLTAETFGIGHFKGPQVTAACGPGARCPRAVIIEVPDTGLGLHKANILGCVQ